MVRRALAALILAAAVAWLLAGARGSAQHGAAPHPAGGDPACSHCHEDPHAGTAAAPCASCHVADSWVPSTFTLAQHARFPLEGRHAEVECSLCHAGAKLTGLPTDCAGCHVDRHRGILGQECGSCHAPAGFTPVAGFDHAQAGFSLTGAHAAAACADCHQGERGAALRSAAPPASCSACHEPEHADFGRPCADCHDAGRPSFAAARQEMSFDHDSTGFPLERRHAVQPCSSCHPAAGPAPLDRCASCHLDPHAGQLTVRCEECHQPDRWRLVRFDHDLTTWPLRGRHFVTPCASCHTSQRWIGLASECWDCHALDAARAPQGVGDHGFGRTDCGQCHSTWSF